MQSRFTRWAVGATVALSLFATVGVAQASSLTSTQVSAIIGLLQSFGADQGTINKVSAALGGKTDEEGLSCASFADVSYGNFDDTPGGRVSRLQTWLGISSSAFGFGTYGRKTQAAWDARCGGAQLTTSSNTNSTSTTNIPTSVLSLLTFTAPQSGAQLSSTQSAQIQWQFIDSSIAQMFSAKNTYVVLHIISFDGKDIGSIGDGFPISTFSTSWNIAAALDQKLYTLASGGKYKIRATLKYQPNFTCDPAMPNGPKDCAPLYSSADQILINKAKQYQSESDWFSVNLASYTQPSATINQASLSQGTQAFVLNGTAANIPYVRINIMNSAGVNVYDSGYTTAQPSIVLNNLWSVSVPALSVGTYTAQVYGYANPQGSSAGAFGLVASSILTVRAQ